MSVSYKNLEVVVKNRYNKNDKLFKIKTSTPHVYITNLFFESFEKDVTITGNLLFFYENMYWISYVKYLDYVNIDLPLRVTIASRSFTLYTDKAFYFNSIQKDINPSIHSVLKPFMQNVSFITTDSISYQFNNFQNYGYMNIINYEETSDSLDNFIYEVDFIMRFKSLVTNDRRFSNMKSIFQTFLDKYEVYTYSYIPYRTEEEEYDIKYIASQILEYCKNLGLTDAEDGYFATMSKLDLLKTSLDYEIVAKNDD